jgi:hypothetical protein
VECVNYFDVTGGDEALVGYVKSLDITGGHEALME